MAALQHRVIMRIEVSGGIPEKLDMVVKRFLSTHISVNSRTIDWVLDQNEEEQAAILKIIPRSPSTALERNLLENIRNSDSR